MAKSRSEDDAGPPFDPDERPDPTSEEVADNDPEADALGQTPASAPEGAPAAARKAGKKAAPKAAAPAQAQIGLKEKPPAPAALPGLTPGRMVHYVLESGPKVGTHRPAIVVDVLDPAGSCELHVFVSRGDFPTGEHPGLGYAAVAAYSEKHEPGTWHWIEPT